MHIIWLRGWCWSEGFVFYNNGTFCEDYNLSERWNPPVQKRLGNPWQAGQRSMAGFKLEDLGDRVHQGNAIMDRGSGVALYVGEQECIEQRTAGNCFEGFGLGELQKSLPAPVILGLCDKESLQ